MDELTTPVERWLPVVDFEGLYEVSDLGRVRSVDRIVPMSDGRQRRCRGQLMGVQLDKDGYPVVNLRRAPVRRVVPVHTLVLGAFVGPRPAGLECCHGDGDASNARLDNLRWDTHSANGLDQSRHGTNHNLIKTHCPRRHLLVEPNVRQSGRARGGCRACHQAGTWLARCRRRGQVLDFDLVADEYYARIMPSETAADASGVVREPAEA